MKILVQLFFIVAIIGRTAVAQEKINQYEYWFDDNYPAKVVTSISPVPALHLISDIPTTGLSDGTHIFNIRFRSESMKYISTLSQFFQKNQEAGSSTRNIIAYEYWIDNNYAGKIIQSVTPQSNVQVLTGISSASFPDGLHTLHIRFKDNCNEWSSVMSQFIHKIPAAGSANRNIVAYEYWIDNNYEGKITQALSSLSEVHVISDISAATFPVGLHTFNIRFKDDGNVWSGVMSQFIHKIPASGSANRNIIAYEYWVDNNFEARITQSVPPQSEVQVITGISAASFTNGPHTLHLRFKDDGDVWSGTLSQFIQKAAPSGSSQNLITAYRYYFDTASHSMTTVTLPSAVNPYNLNASIFTGFKPRGHYSINLQFKDTLQQWSSMLTDTFNIVIAIGGDIAGKLKYDNILNTPLHKVWVILKVNGIRSDSVRTNLNGDFLFEHKFNGTYTLNPRTDKAWAGVNGTDAIKIQRHFAGLEYLTTPVRLLAADVNLTSSINGTDALKVKRRFSGLDLTFPRGDWTFAKPTGGDTIVIFGGDVLQDFQGLCVGDVNGSNTPAPGDIPNSNSVYLTHNGVIEVSSGQEFILPIRVSNPGLINAISMVIPYQSDLLEVLDVTTPVGSPAFTARNEQIRIAWSELQTLNLKAGDILLTLKLKATKSFTGNTAIDLLATSESELADETGTAIPYAELFTQTIKTIELTGSKDPNSILQQCTMYPNPASYVLNIELVTTQNAALTIEVADMLGKKKTFKNLGEILPGKSTFQINTADLPNGVYAIKFSLENKNKKNTLINKLSIQR